MREAGAIDLSAPIRQFCEEHGIAAPDPPDGARHGGYRTADMAGTTFHDLWLRVGGGAGYVYCHQVLPLTMSCFHPPHCCPQMLQDVAESW